MRIGIDIGGSHIAVGLINGARIVDCIVKDFTDEDRADISNVIIDSIINFIDELLNRNNRFFNDIECIGISAPGTAVDGVMLTSGRLGISDFPIEKIIHEKIDLPISVRNDAKCAAIAEKEYGCLKGFDRSIFLTLGTGIGGAVFNNGELLDCGNRPGYEIGHMVIDKNGIECNCGKKGCFEVYGSMKAFKMNLRRSLNLDLSTRGKILLQMIKDTRPGDKGYDIIQSVIEEYINNLSIGISNLISIFEPEVIGIGGGFVHFSDILLPKIRDKLNLKIQDREIKLEVATLGNDAGIIGATL